MRLILSTALDKVLSFVGTTIQKVKGLKKPQLKFLVWLFERWLMLPVRYNFLNLGRYGGYSERSIRHHFSQKLPFMELFHCFFEGIQQKECIAVFDPSYISKSGKKTYGLGKFWSGTAQQVKKGLEAGCLSIVDTEAATAYSMEVVQTPAPVSGDAAEKEKESLVKHYGKVLTERVEDIKRYTDIVAVDGYFMKQGFINELTAKGLKVITKARLDANMKYLYEGEQSKSRGRKKAYAGKVVWQNIEKDKWKRCGEDVEAGWEAYEAVLYSAVLKRKVKVVYVEHKESKRYELLVGTEEGMEGKEVLKYYRLRFQIEFLIRDAKGYTGLEHCQGRTEEKLYNHLNMAMLTVSVAKYELWAKQQTKEENNPFSIRSIKTWCMNKYMTETIFSNLGLDLTCNKIKELYYKCLNIGSMAA